MEKKVLRNLLYFGISENFPFSKLRLFATTKRILITLIKENNHLLCVSKPLKFH